MHARIQILSQNLGCLEKQKISYFQTGTTYYRDSRDINHQEPLHNQKPQMLQSLSHHFLSPNIPVALSHLHNSSVFSSPVIYFPYRPTTLRHVLALPRARPETWLAEVPEPTSAPALEEGPIELPPSTPSIFATTDDPAPIQVATSVLLTGAISVFLFRAVRRRARRAKELVLFLFLFLLF
jgi:hypothetical protein